MELRRPRRQHTRPLVGKPHSRERFGDWALPPTQTTATAIRRPGSQPDLAGASRQLLLAHAAPTNPRAQLPPPPTEVKQAPP